MRLRRHRIVRCALFAGLLCWFAPAWHAEVSVVVRNTDTDVGSLIVSPAAISEDADPIPQVSIRWQQYRSVPSTIVLNLTGDVREDGSPNVVYRRTTNQPLAAWAYQNGSDHDIAFSEWDGYGWSDAEFVTFDAEDELDPRLFPGSDGDLHLVWWVDGTDPRVMLTSRSMDDSAWGIPVRVSPPGEIACRPTVAVHQGAVWVAYERERSIEPVGMRDLVVRRLEPGGSFVEEHMIDVPRTERSDPVLHARAGRFWIDWKHSSTQFGSAAYLGPGWDAPTFHGWSDPSWVGVEGMRLFIRRVVFATTDVADLGP